jgi:hypothetical protein
VDIVSCADTCGEAHRHVDIVTCADTCGEAHRHVNIAKVTGAFLDIAKAPRVNNNKIKNVHVHVIIKYWKG